MSPTHQTDTENNTSDLAQNQLLQDLGYDFNIKHRFDSSSLEATAKDDIHIYEDIHLQMQYRIHKIEQPYDNHHARKLFSQQLAAAAEKLEAAVITLEQIRKRHKLQKQKIMDALRDHLYVEIKTETWSGAETQVASAFSPDRVITFRLTEPGVEDPASWISVGGSRRR